MKRILLADDDSAIRLLVNATLRSKEYTLVEAIDGEQALSLARETLPDLVLLDVSMPKLDGAEVCRLLKSDPATQGIRIIMLTGRPQGEDDSAGSGPDGYFTKPFSPLALLDKIAEVLA